MCRRSQGRYAVAALRQKAYSSRGLDLLPLGEEPVRDVPSCVPERARNDVQVVTAHKYSARPYSLV